MAAASATHLSCWRSSPRAARKRATAEATVTSTVAANTAPPASASACSVPAAASMPSGLTIFGLALSGPGSSPSTTDHTRFATITAVPARRQPRDR